MLSACLSNELKQLQFSYQHKIKRVTSFATKEKLKFKQSGKEVVITLPQTLDLTDYIIVVE